MPIVYAKPGGKTLVRLIANATLVIAGNNTVSNVSTSVAEIVESATITKVFWSGNGQFTITRGANTQLTLHGNGWWDLYQHGIVLSEDPTANVVVTNSSGSTGSILIELSKKSNLSGTQ